MITKEELKDVIGEFSENDFSKYRRLAEKTINQMLHGDIFATSQDPAAFASGTAPAATDCNCTCGS